MINVDEIKRFVEFCANKSQAGSNPTPTKFNLAVKRAQMEWVMERYGNPNTYQPGMPVPRIAYQQTQKITDDLKFLLSKPTPLQVDKNGKANYPDDYLHMSSVRYKYKKKLSCNKKLILKEVDVTNYKDAEIGHVKTSQIVQPTKRYPYYAFYDDCMIFDPKDLGTVTITYLREPIEPIWAYELVNGRPVYDPLNSVDLEAPDEALNEIAMRTLSFLGIHIREPQLIQYAETLKAQGV
jgi:hypothetical protein